MKVGELGCFVPQFRPVGSDHMAGFPIFIISVEQYGFLGDIPHPDIFDKDVIHQTSFSHAALEAKPDIRAGEGAIADKDIVHAAVRVATDHEPAVGAAYPATGDDHVVKR